MAASESNDPRWRAVVLALSARILVSRHVRLRSPVRSVTAPCRGTDAWSEAMVRTAPGLGHSPLVPR
ncbi:hypothetical protein GCM10022402_04730 [Salinactinospora qingdaonensis]|uniref:Uncharacterized protein n=1 Tax=Salinactinospora qingdaonensis TaxID=702744 RepID=A0ABP7EZC9_9ACTN